MKELLNALKEYNIRIHGKDSLGISVKLFDDGSGSFFDGEYERHGFNSVAHAIELLEKNNVE